MSRQQQNEPHDLDTSLSRRSFLQCSLAGLASLALGTGGLVPASSHALSPPTDVRVGSRIPPLFCIAYVDPEIVSQADQEATIARYPLAIVPQSIRPAQMRWRDQIRQLNPKQIMLGYQIVIEETMVPGPGHDQIRRAQDSWCVYPGGHRPTVDVGTSRRNLRLFDPRKPEWQDAFLKACRATLESYPYDGLFLDQCSVFEKAHPFPHVKAEMRQALQLTLLRLRQEYPDTLLIGNSSYNWQGLNGELNEGRLKSLTEELAAFDGHAKPNMELYHSLLRHPDDIETVRREMALAHLRGAFYSASVTYQHILWFDVFDEVIAQHS